MVERKGMGAEDGEGKGRKRDFLSLLCIFQQLSREPCLKGGIYWVLFRKLSVVMITAMISIITH